MNPFDWLFPQTQAPGTGLPAAGGLGQILEPQTAGAAPGGWNPAGPLPMWPQGDVGSPMMPPPPSTPGVPAVPGATSTPDGSTTLDQSAPEAASQQAGAGWQDRLANVLKNVKTPAPPDVVKPSTPAAPRPHAQIDQNFTRILLARAQAGGGTPSIPLALGRVLGGR